MKRHNWCWTLIALSLAMVVSLTAGCLTITGPEEPAQPSTAPEESSPWSTTPEPSGPRPDINYFTATPETISLGQSITLSWDVSNATSATIDPSVGQADPRNGSVQLSPTRSTTYTLTATNAGGDITSKLTVTVTEAVTGMSDLVVTDIWLAGSIVYYKIKNQGNAEAKLSRSYLYVNDVEEASGYAESLAAGQEKTESFSNWPWTYGTGIGGGALGPGTVLDIEPYSVKICADGDDAVGESAERNNCTTETWGATFSYDFVETAHLAEWRSGVGQLKWPMVGSDTKGAAFFNHSALEDGRTYANALATYPQQASHGSIQGRFGEVYSEYGATRSGEIKVPANATFTAMVGFKDGATATDGVKVAFGYVDPSGAVIILKTLDVYYDGMLDVVDVPLSSIAGEEVYFILRGEAGESWEQDWLVWVNPKVEQPADSPAGN